MTFTNDIPISGDTLGSTRDRIRANFQETNAVISINHIGFNQLGKGKHIYLQMPEVAASGVGVPVTLANEAGFYSKNGTNPVEPNLWFRGQTNGFEYQLTNANQANSATFGTFTNYPPGVVNQNGGWTFLPGGLILQYGTAVIAGSPSPTKTIVNFPIPFTSTSISITTANTSLSGNATGITNKTLTTFTMNRGGTANQSVNWMAIGK